MAIEIDADILKAELTRDEGLRAEIYKDSRGFTTVGIGHNLSIAQSTFSIAALYQDDVNGCIASLNQRWPWWQDLDPVRQRVMLNMVFNMGGAKLAGFTHFLAAMQEPDWAEASRQMLNSDWAEQVGVRAGRLAHMILTGSTT